MKTAVARVEVFAGLATQASRALSAERARAGERSDAVIRRVEELLVDALAGDTLRGMPDLGPPHLAFYARRIHANGRLGSAGSLVWAKEVPVLTSKGKLVWAKIGDRREVVAREPEASDMNADLLEPYLQAVQAALEDHLARTEKRTQTYEAASDLAQRIGVVIGLNFR